MITKKMLITIGICIILLIITTSSALSVGFSNYNSNNVSRWAPQIDSFNSYQIDAEYASALVGPAFLMWRNNFQDWLGGPPPPPPPPVNPNGVEIHPGGAATWILNVPPNPILNPLPPGFVNYPEVKWGVYHMALVLVTTNNQSQNMVYGPTTPVKIEIYVDNEWAYAGTVWSRDWRGSHTVHNADNYTIPIDFHLNYGQGPVNPPYDNQWWTGAQHFIEIFNIEPAAGNHLWLDEFHLTSGCYI